MHAQACEREQESHREAGQDDERIRKAAESVQLIEQRVDGLTRDVNSCRAD